ncbi:M28 family peptidase [Erythrobacteraceae bacterium CFH 75059]|uniref:M28 family peptidase n=1 Tax=Qipengyuania thermophila TaxID=2509361 RepID=UPI00101FBBF2|nr:M28 family peptidase [Qipengyuania thermophila]TCD05194.1 M28 family peptidase [Erythrobacteraceae bacterium CFH 75059]
MKTPFALALLLTTSAAFAQETDTAFPVAEDRLRGDVETLVAFGTRHTLSSQDDPRRGIGAAVDWSLAEMRRIAAACGGCLEIVAPEQTLEGARLPGPTRIRNAVAIQRGFERPDEVVIVQAHIDSRVSDVMNADADAPGANDNASGSALVLEAARVLSQRRYPVTIVYALLSGEEQGLYGGRVLADTAASRGWQVKAVLNNDIVGNSCGSDGLCDAAHVRVFSEGQRADLSPALRAAQRRDGGENDSPSRNLSRWLAELAAEDASGLAVRQIWRTDRMGRGGDQIPFQERGIPAIRFSVAVEDYNHQHQDLRVEEGIRFGDTVEAMDFAYLARVTRLNVRALDALARTPAPPAPTATAAVQTFTALSWQPVPGARSYTVWQRRTDEPNWPRQPVRAGLTATQLRLDGVRGDDWLFGVSACDAAGQCSPVASAVPAGAFRPAEAPGQPRAGEQ